MPRRRRDRQLRLRPGLVQVPGVLDRADDVVAAMDDDAGDVGDLAHVAKQLVVDLEDAAVAAVMVVDQREGNRAERVGVAEIGRAAWWDRECELEEELVVSGIVTKK